MRYLILSDIHANIDAFEAVLAAAPVDTWDRVLVLGDLVGYGAEPNAVIERVRALDPLAVIRGNHDKAAPPGLTTAAPSTTLAKSRPMTHERSYPAHREYLRVFRQGPVTIDDTIEICHGRRSTNIITSSTRKTPPRGLDAASRPLSLFATRSFSPSSFDVTPALVRRFMPKDPATPPWTSSRGCNYRVHVGSVGQPRDGDPARGVWFMTRRIVAGAAPGRVSVQTAQRRILSADYRPVSRTGSRWAVTLSRFATMILLCRAFFARRNSAANASCAALEPRIQPDHDADEQHCGNEMKCRRHLVKFISAPLRRSAGSPPSVSLNPTEALPDRPEVTEDRDPGDRVRADHERRRGQLLPCQ